LSVDNEQIRSRLKASGQDHILDACEKLDPARASSLMEQASRLPLESLPELIERFVCCESGDSSSTDISPPRVTMPDPELAAALTERGEQVIREGRVAAFTVAGGQGTRLGWGGPKGTYPATPVSGKPLFRVFAEQIEAASIAWNTPIRWYIMTSEANDAATRAFFADNNWFGLPRTQIMLFPQGMMPCFDMHKGNVLLEAPDRLAMSPDGHGGSIAALHASGALEEMSVLGIDTISYFQVDNPLSSVIDPMFIGLHADPERSSGEMSSKMVPKRESGEKVGVFCRVGDHTRVIEYSDMPQSLMTEVDDNGRLRYDAGNIAIHLLGVDFARRVFEANELPWHRAVKKVPYFDLETDSQIAPESPNGVKLERFIFDALGLASNPAILEVDRSLEFAPIKNAAGEDSPESCRQAQNDLYGGWLESRGIEVARNEEGHVLADIEISPLSAMGSDDLKSEDLPEAVGSGDRILI
tara:strand:+ start:262 stop:1671 length:1410 start_codon:yes stop_codon:yes gene_type:complete